MSRLKKRKSLIDRTELKVFIIRHYENEREFCKINGLNYPSFRTLMSGHIGMPNFETKILEIVKSKNYPVEIIMDPVNHLFMENSKLTGKFNK
jgi:hypothetical protein